jgi:hypothetical protein
MDLIVLIAIVLIALELTRVPKPKKEDSEKTATEPKIVKTKVYIEKIGDVHYAWRQEDNKFLGQNYSLEQLKKDLNLVNAS